MKTINRRELCASLPFLGVLGAELPNSFASQVHSSEYPAPQGVPSGVPDGAAREKPGAPMAGATAGPLARARVFEFDQMPVRTMANGGESRNIVHGVLTTGETVNLHQSIQVVGGTPNPAHVIQHTEFILVREGELEFQHEVQGATVAERVGPGGVIYVAFGTKHAVKNVGSIPAKYFVVAIGGDAK